MTYDERFDLLESFGINMSEVFVYPDVEPHHHLFARTANNMKYDVKSPETEYFNRLAKYISLAAQRNIIVQLSLAGIPAVSGRLDQ